MNSTTSGQPRLLNLEEFAALIRKMREVFQWSQETLAELTGLNVRTVQRVENAKSASFDTRRALARAFEIEGIDAFNKPYIIPTEEELKEEKARFDRDHITLPALPFRWLNHPLFDRHHRAAALERLLPMTNGYIG